MVSAQPKRKGLTMCRALAPIAYSGSGLGCTYCEILRDVPVNAAVTQAFRLSQDDLEKLPTHTEISVIRLAEMACVTDLSTSKPLLSLFQAAERVLCLAEGSGPF